ncbi:MAG TPA: nuclear transport factor 2 family protein [Blastocatellia bacterium]|nr:nuclear transport factor 2 family protein [Blastocatellia bacterium]
MKKFPVTLLLALICVSLAIAQHRPGGTEQAILKLEQEWVEALTKADTAALERIYHNDLTYTHSSGVVDTKASYIAGLKSGNTKYLSLDREEIKVRIYGDTAIVTCKAAIRLLNKEQSVSFTARLIHVYVRQGGRWQMVAHQSTRLAS